MCVSKLRRTLHQWMTGWTDECVKLRMKCKAPTRLIATWSSMAAFSVFQPEVRLFRRVVEVPCRRSDRPCTIPSDRSKEQEAVAQEPRRSWCRSLPHHEYCQDAFVRNTWAHHLIEIHQESLDCANNWVAAVSGGARIMRMLLRQQKRLLLTLPIRSNQLELSNHNAP